MATILLSYPTRAQPREARTLCARRSAASFGCASRRRRRQTAHRGCKSPPTARREPGFTPSCKNTCKCKKHLHCGSRKSPPTSPGLRVQQLESHVEKYLVQKCVNLADHLEKFSKTNLWLNLQHVCCMIRARAPSFLRVFCPWRKARDGAEQQRVDRGLEPVGPTPWRLRSDVGRSFAKTAEVP